MRSDVASLTRFCFAFVLLLLPPIYATAESPDSPDGMWIDLTSTDLNTLPAKTVPPETIVRPTEFRAVWLDEAYLDEVLRFAPMEDVSNRAQLRKSEVTLWLPMPDGSNVEFAFVESPIMELELAEKFPEIKTYAGRSLDGRDLFVRFDRTPKSFHAIVLGGRAVYIDPYKQDGVYVSYFAADYPTDASRQCFFEEPEQREVSKGAPVLTLHGDTLRTFRFAVACTGEYANFHGATTPETKGMAVAAITTAVNRVNGILESELIVRLMLVDTNDQIVFIDPATDPFTNPNDIDTIAAEAVTAISSGIGFLNFDIGHTVALTNTNLGTSRPGVCVNGNKAEAATGGPQPIGDPFNVDFFVHEIGHQFRARHTFNSEMGTCSGERLKQYAYERGSGSTIMGYAGICPSGGGGDNIQAHSDPFFHSESLRQIQLELSDLTCQTSAATNNLGPVMNAGPDYTIPKKTPFVLTAAANDVEGDTVTVSWEERDLGPAQAITAKDNKKSPLFRCYPPKTDCFRTFPDLQLILAGTENGNPYELLPSKARTMTFWAVGRDGKGGFGSDETKVTVNANAGPFKVTYPNSAVTITGGRKKKVKWNVANTSLSPINASTVRIRLSTDGGATFPIILKDSTPNDGVEKVKFPNLGAASARVKVEAVGNIFFDISDRNFAISGGYNLIGTWAFNLIYIGEEVPLAQLVFGTDTATWCYTPVNPGSGCLDNHLPYTFEDLDDPVYTKKLSIPGLSPPAYWYCKIIDNNKFEAYTKVVIPQPPGFQYVHYGTLYWQF